MKVIDGEAWFNEGDIVEILKDSRYYKKGELVVVECCGEELGGANSLKLVCEKKYINKLKEII